MRRIIFAFLLSIAVIASSSVPTYAATTTLTVDGDGTYAVGGYGAGAFAGMNADDAYTTYYVIAGVGGYKTWTFSNPGLGAGSTINSVTVHIKGQINQAANYFYIVYYNGTSVYTDSVLNSLTPAWTDYSKTWTTNPATGIAWTEAQVNAAQFGVNSSASGWGAQYTYAYVVVDYTAATAPMVTTQAVSAITPTTATGNGTIVSNGGGALTEKGICCQVGAAGDPTTADFTSHDHVDSLGAYTAAMAGLTKGTAYRVRAYAINATGTGYGVTVGVTMIGDPTISTSAASLVSSTTARLNSNVTFDGSVVTGEPCTIRFVYIAGTPYADYAAIVAGAETTVDVAGTWTTGQSPYADITGLTGSTTYSYAVRIVNSTATYAYGAVSTFTTESGVYTPTNFTAIPTATTVSLAWAKGVGAQYTLVKYADSTYPIVVGDGIAAYLDTGNSKTLTGLTPGTTYYFTAWGKTAAVYSASSITVMATTLAYDTAASTGTIESPPTNSWWNQTPSTAKVSNIPLVSGLVSANATAYAIPEASLWYFLWVLFSIGTGVVIYAKSGNNLPMSLGAQALLFALGAGLGLVMLWIMVLFMVIGAGFTLWGDRR